MYCAWKFHPILFKGVCNSYCFNADLTIYEFCNTKRIITVTTVVEGLTNKVLLQWKGLQTRCSNMSKPQKDDNLREWMGGLVWSTIQKVQIVHQLECSYASFMLSLRYYLCLFYTNYASTKKKQCYVVSCLSVYFLPPRRRGTIWSMRWEVWSGQYFRRSREFISLNFRMLLLCYHYILFHYLFWCFYKYYASPKQQYYMILWLSVSFILPQRRKRNREIGWEVRFGKHFRR